MNHNGDDAVRSNSFHERFQRACREFVDDVLAELGFVKKEPQKPSSNFCNTTYCNGELYVQFSCTDDVRDHPVMLYVLLGEGSTEDFFEWDWSHIALWRLTEEKNLGKKGYYLHTDNITIEEAVSHAITDLIECGQDFLSGDLKLFKKVRAKITREREPYKVHSPFPLDESSKTFIEKSIEVREKFSKEE